MSNYNYNTLCHHGIKGQKWGIRRFQNEDGTLTAEGRKRYDVDDNGNMSKKGEKLYKRDAKDSRLVEGGNRSLISGAAKGAGAGAIMGGLVGAGVGVVISKTIGGSLKDTVISAVGHGAIYAGEAAATGVLAGAIGSALYNERVDKARNRLSKD